MTKNIRIAFTHLDDPEQKLITSDELAENQWNPKPNNSGILPLWCEYDEDGNLMSKTNLWHRMFTHDFPTHQEDLYQEIHPLCSAVNIDFLDLYNAVVRLINWSILTINGQRKIKTEGNCYGTGIDNISLDGISVCRRFTAYLDYKGPNVFMDLDFRISSEPVPVIQVSKRNEEK